MLSFGKELKDKEQILKYDESLVSRFLPTCSSFTLIGIAFTGALCTTSSVSLVEDHLTFISMTTATHELGHRYTVYNFYRQAVLPFCQDTC